ncbi:hypothetical protein, partial [Bacillus paranthracis]|uniref:hypothetical protein n=2 Tax=Bacillus TaxID=1386 RepID=UPI003A806609
HAASVHPEPGSNSPIKLVCLASKIKIDVSRCLFRLVFKVQHRVSATFIIYHSILFSSTSFFDNLYLSFADSAYYIGFPFPMQVLL